jgi:RND family efflux transporter MFP subunit
MAAPEHDLSRLRIERNPGPRRGFAWGRWLLVLAAVALAWWFWPQLSALVERQPEVVLGRAQRLGGSSSVSGTAANGYVVARRQAALSTDIQGRLVELRVEEGDAVEAGQLIARLDTRQLEATLRRTRAELETARASAELSRLDFERKQPLLASGDISQAELDVARYALEEAEARVASLQAAVAEIEVMIDKSSVYAPFSGVITSKNAEVGEVVSSIASGGNSRGSVATLVDFDTLEVQVELAQTSLAAAREDAPVRIFLDAFPDQGYPGRVRQIWPTADRQKATVELRIDFLERDERILPEMGVRVVFVGEQASQDEPSEPVVVVPERALLDGDEPAVFVHRDGRIRRQAVQLGGSRPGGRRVVLAGLDGSESVVLDPSAKLSDGQQVRLREDA